MKILSFLGTGASHEAKGQACQDRILTQTHPDGKTILAVADGCSSSLYGGEAAQCNVEVVSKIFSRCSIDSLNYKVFLEAFPGIRHYEKECSENLIDCFDFAFKASLFKLSKKIIKKPHRFEFEYFCATVLFAICEKEKIFIGHIGDGNIICFDKKGDIVYRSAEENGVDSSHTYFTARPDFYKHFHYDIIPAEDVECIMMFSDGPQNMFKCECGSISKGACELVAKPAINGEINSNLELFEVLKERIGHAKHYVSDDWSMVVALKENAYGTEPVSLNAMFQELFNKIRFDDFGNIISDGKARFDTDNSIKQRFNNKQKAKPIFRKDNSNF